MKETAELREHPGTSIDAFPGKTFLALGVPGWTLVGTLSIQIQHGSPLQIPEVEEVSYSPTPYVYHGSGNSLQEHIVSYATWVAFQAVIEMRYARLMVALRARSELPRTAVPTLWWQPHVTNLPGDRPSSRELLSQSPKKVPQSPWHDLSLPERALATETRSVHCWLGGRHAVPASMAVPLMCFACSHVYYIVLLPMCIHFVSWRARLSGMLPKNILIHRCLNFLLWCL